MARAEQNRPVLGWGKEGQWGSKQRGLVNNRGHALLWTDYRHYRSAVSVPCLLLLVAGCWVWGGDEMDTMDAMNDCSAQFWFWLFFDHQ